MSISSEAAREHTVVSPVRHPCYRSSTNGTFLGLKMLTNEEAKDGANKDILPVIYVVSIGDWPFSNRLTPVVHSSADGDHDCAKQGHQSEPCSGLRG